VSASRPLRAAALVLVAGLLAGCAGPGPTVAGDPGAPASPASRAAGDAPGQAAARLLSAVPFVAQPDFQCGPAALAIAMAAAGRPVPVETLARGTFVPGRQGSLQPEMLAAGRRHGMLATELPPDLGALRREIDAGRPVVVLQNLGLAMLPRWHYAVVVGYDMASGELRLHSGDQPAMAMRLSVFERTWARSGRWAIALTLPDRLPESATEPQAVRAAIGLERVDAAAARQSWDAVLERWPASRLGRFGRGNLRLGGGDAAGAADDYRAAVATDPAFGDAWNNLAQALIQSGDADAARAAADRAVAIGGPRADAYRGTRHTIGP
jgi:hypothetical protein